ncbi:MAG: CoA-binding protein [Alphaproteobacteria bacterium]|nr:CoA-binding protein [Alphaproteobacteria bacterium]
MPAPPSDPGLFKALFEPTSIALIGASDDPAKNAGRPLRFLRRHGYAGAIYPVNPQRATIQGERAYASLADLPGPVDHAYILLGADAAIAAIEACASVRVPVATLLADGFAEAGTKGVERQRRLLAAAAKGGVRLVGPNSLGIVNAATGLALSANAALQAERLLPGNLMVLSQSGSLIGTLLSRGFARGIGFSKLISVGNEADLDIGTIGSLAVDDPQTATFLLFLETVRQPERLSAFARRAHEAGKPILAYVLGRSDLGQELAVSHTGALVGSRTALTAFLADRGIARVDCLETLIEAPALFMGRHPLGRPGAVGIVTTTGGGGAMIADGLGGAGVTVAAPSPATRNALVAAGIADAGGRIVDVTLAGTRPEIMTAALRAMIVAPEFDLIVSVVGSSAQFYPELAADPVAAAAKSASKPVSVFAVPEAPTTLERLARAGVPAFRTPESCVDAVRAFLVWRQPRTRPSAATFIADAARSIANRAGMLDELEALTLFARLGIACTPTVFLDDAPPAIAYPAAVKILSPSIAHKTEIGGVVLDLADERALRQAANDLRKRIANSRGVLAQTMECGLGEALIGYRWDPQVGPVVTVAPGGVLTELYGDIAVCPAPVDATTAADMIAMTRGLRALTGYRNRPRGDLAALADAIARLSQLAFIPAVQEAEINPLIVRADGAGIVAVDGLARLETTG